MVRWAGRRGRDGVRAWRIVRPDEQDRARSVVDHETVRPAEAFRPEPGTVAVAGQDEQIRTGGGRRHLLLDAPLSLGPGAGAAQPARRLRVWSARTVRVGDAGG